MHVDGLLAEEQIVVAGLVRVVALAEQVGVPLLVLDHLAIVDATNGAGANPDARVMSLLAGMVAGADSIEEVDRLRHAGYRFVFAEMRAPSTLGTLPRSFTHGHALQLNQVLREGLVRLVEQVDLLGEPANWCSST